MACTWENNGHDGTNSEAWLQNALELHSTLPGLRCNLPNETEKQLTETSQYFGGKK